MCDADGKDPDTNSPMAQLPRPPAHVCTPVIITVVQLQALLYTFFPESAHKHFPCYFSYTFSTQVKIPPSAYHYVNFSGTFK